MRDLWKMHDASFNHARTEKAPIEFIKNENDPSTFQTLVLESTPTDQKGLDYDLIEMYDRGLAQYYRSGVLKFRLTS